MVTLLHPPYTAWHLSYVVFGAVAARHIYPDRFLATLVAFFLAVGVAAHAFDERYNRPLKTQLADRTLTALACMSLVAAVGIGIAGVVTVSATLAPFVVVGGFLVLAYNLELWGGRFHNSFWFAAGWGAFPALTSWWANTTAIHDVSDVLAGSMAVAGCFAMSVVQNRLSVPLRRLRRKTVSVVGEQRLADGQSLALSIPTLMAPLEAALKTISIALVALSIGMVALRL